MEEIGSAGNPHKLLTSHMNQLTSEQHEEHRCHIYAQYNLGVMYGKGQGVPQDNNIAVKWWKLAAKQGYANVQFNLAVMYYKGQGVPKDYVYAHMWANLAAANGDEKGGKARDAVEKLMTPSQIAEAQKLARECERKKCTGVEQPTPAAME
jgi:TPR repeat protein